MRFKFIENLGREVRDTLLRFLRDYSEALLLAVILAVILRLFVFGSYKISNVTMEPGLKLGDFVLGYRLPYGVTLPFTSIKLGATRPQRGDIVVFRCPDNRSQNCVKRVVAVEGDRVVIKGKNLIINGHKALYAKSKQSFGQSRDSQEIALLTEKWMSNPSREILISSDKKLSHFGPYIVPPKTFFALGDNRDFSEDSRHWAAIPIEHIESRLFLVWFSVEWSANVKGEYSSKIRWSRILHSL